MRHQIRFVAVLVLALFTTGGLASAHCQIPCGIYDDELRVQLIEEHIGTIEKSMKKIKEHKAANALDVNQATRWVMNKEEHAQKIQDIVTAYFMAQRIKVPADSESKAYEMYTHRLTLLHQILVDAMRAKQGTDLEKVESLKKLIAEFRTAYFGEKGSHSH